MLAVEVPRPPFEYILLETKTPNCSIPGDNHCALETYKMIMGARREWYGSTDFVISLCVDFHLSQHSHDSLFVL